jgi:hypothetical protein
MQIKDDMKKYGDAVIISCTATEFDNKKPFDELMYNAAKFVEKAYMIKAALNKDNVISLGSPLSLGTDDHYYTEKQVNAIESINRVLLDIVIPDGVIIPVMTQSTFLNSTKPDSGFVEQANILDRLRSLGIETKSLTCPYDSTNKEIVRNFYYKIIRGE